MNWLVFYRMVCSWRDNNDPQLQPLLIPLNIVARPSQWITWSFVVCAQDFSYCSTLLGNFLEPLA